MKQFFGATLMLAAAVMAADAQTGDGRVEHTTSERLSSPGARLEPARAEFSGRLFDSQPESPSPPAPPSDAAPSDAAPSDDDAEQSEGSDETTRAGAHFRWGAAVRQTLLFLSVQHGYALTQPKTRRDLHGSFFKDYVRSVRSLHGWGDGGRFFTNYIAHPMQGSLLGFVQIQNDPAGSRLRFNKGAYWRSRMKALAWSAAWSTQFEIGPVSQASLGNVGLHGKQTYVDLVMTPTAGLGLLVAEDALDRYLIERLERRTNNVLVRIISRMTLNPTRTAANLLRFKKPWHRDAGLR